MNAGTKSPLLMTPKPPFDQIYQSHYDRVWRFLLHAAADVPTAMELTARCFERALRAWPRYEPTGAPVEAWLLRIAVNEWRRELRRRTLSRFLPLPEPAGTDWEAEHVDLIEVNAAVDSLERDEEYQALRRAIAALPEKYETPLLLRYFEAHSLEEVAAILGRPVGTVKSLVHRGLARLRQDQGLRESLGLSLLEATPQPTKGQS
jgi:RNA polymerase sigma-70 factor, ECF subfamily